MSEEKPQIEILDESLDVPAEQDQFSQQDQRQVGIKLGYVVGVDDQDELLFQIMGPRTDLLNLLGLHRYAEDQIEQIKNANLRAGWPVLAQQLDAIASQIKVITQTLSVIEEKIQESEANTLPDPSNT
jgi:hypothetical protein